MSSPLSRCSLEQTLRVGTDKPSDCAGLAVVANLIFSLQGLIWDTLTFTHESSHGSEAHMGDAASSDRTDSAKIKMERGRKGSQGIDESAGGRAARSTPPRCISDFPGAYTDVAPTWPLLVSYSLILIVGGRGSYNACIRPCACIECTS